MRKDAEAHAEDDKKQREEVETRNEADNLIYRNEKLLKDNKDKISGDSKSNLEKAIAEVKDALKDKDASAIKTASEKLNEISQAVGAEIYKAAAEKAQAGKAQAAPGGEAKSEEKQGSKDEGPIIDAEVVDEKK
jgi:molecular chaperone DnaK